MLAFTIEPQIIENGLNELSEWMKLHLLQVNPDIFDRLDFDNESTFLEPALIFHFLVGQQAGNASPLEQILWGYRPDEYKDSGVKVFADQFGTINLPNYGCYKYHPHQHLTLHWDNQAKVPYFKSDAEIVSLEKMEDRYLSGTSIKLCNHVPELLTKSFGTPFLEAVAETTATFQKSCEEGLDIIKQMVPDLYHAMSMTCREVTLFNSEHQVSMAALDYYGTAFLNIENQDHDEVFFVDDLAHQCGHLVFYALTLHPENFLRVSRDTPLKDFSGVEWEGRKVYGIFHGLFTYTCILSCLDRCLEHALFSGKQYREALGRLGFYMNKFRCDLGYINDRRILSAAGFAYFDQFKEGYDRLYWKYRHLLHELDYSNQPYIFKFDRFSALNTNLQPV
ncbi:hypothetical protein [Chitinophaga polysaccharea]|uniref:hypothetical protein n=1 Tax=Chitinophaga polysaccharea TaxID=1293035 RepID=UPI001156CF6F|nr:hypothetical protein [Chitinophaga polysaccharea]